MDLCAPRKTRTETCRQVSAWNFCYSPVHHRVQYGELIPLNTSAKPANKLTFMYDKHIFYYQLVSRFILLSSHVVCIFNLSLLQQYESNPDFLQHHTFIPYLQMRGAIEFIYYLSGNAARTNGSSPYPSVFVQSSPSIYTRLFKPFPDPCCTVICTMGWWTNKKPNQYSDTALVELRYAVNEQIEVRVQCD